MLFWDLTQVYRMTFSDCLLGLQFDPEEGRNTLFRNVDEFISYYTACYQRRQSPS
jgi:hypothetical protein